MRCQLAGTDQQVVAEARGTDRSQPAAHLWPVQPAGIWLILDLVPDARQLATARQAT